MSKPNPVHPVNTFVIRVRREWSTNQAIWRGSIEHLESKRQSGFEDFERILAFFHSFSIFTDERYPNNEEN